MSLPSARNERLAILAVLLLALVVRAWGLDWGLPRTDFNPDEEMVLQITQGISWDDLDPGFYNYSGLTFHLNFFATELAGALGVEITDSSQLFVHRLLNLLFAVLTALLVYAIGRGMKLDHATSLTAMAVYALLPLAAWDAHFAVADTGLAFWTALALWLALRAYADPTLARFAIGGVAVGFAMGAKFNGALGGASFIAAAVLVWWEGRATPVVAIRNLFAAGAISLLAFGIASPYSIIHVDEMFDAFDLEWYEVRKGHYGFDMSADGWQYRRGLYQLAAMFPFGFGIAMWPMVLLGAVLLTWRGKPMQRAFAWSHLALYLWTISSWSLVPLRYYLPVLPILAIFGGHGLVAVWRARRLPRALVVGIPVVVLAYTAVYTAATVDRFRHDTRTESGDWLQDNLPDNARVALLYPGFEISYMPEITRPDVEIVKVPLEQTRGLLGWARQAPERSYVVVSSLTYARDYRQGRYASIPDQHRRWHNDPDPIGQWEYVRNNPEYFQPVARFQAWFPNRSLYTYLDPMYDGYFVSPTIEIYRHDPEAMREYRRLQRLRERGLVDEDGNPIEQEPAEPEPGNEAGPLLEGRDPSIVDPELLEQEGGEAQR